jgi:ribosomal protein L1
MGKIRVKTLGDEEQEAKDKAEQERKRAEKKAREEAEKNAPEANAQPSNEASSDENAEESKPKKEKKSKFAKSSSRSANYTAKVMEVDKAKSYPLSEALDLLKKVDMTKFDGTVELHINTNATGISGTMKLPHGTGKELRIAVANDEIIGEVEKGKINFDILIAAPSFMPKLARVAKILGPRGLMPNPKNGTISDNPEEAMKKFAGGQIGYKTESKNPIIHLSVGKMSFGNEKLSENIKTVISTIKRDRILKVTLKSTMSPGIRIQI